MYDLHIHSLYSDGKFDIENILINARKKKLKGIALTDHDTIDGLEEMNLLSKKYDIDFIPGIEFSVSYKNKEIHILGYDIDYKNKDLINLCNILKKDREKRTIKIIDKLKSLNINIEYDELLKYSKKDIIGRLHIAQLLVDKKYVKNIKEAFDIYLGNNKKAFIKKDTKDICQILKIIKKIGGVSILAHPVTLKDDKIVKEIIELGVNGLEIINSKHTYNDILKYNIICDRYNLLKTGGSDCHGLMIENNTLLGNYLVSEKYVNQIKKYL